MGVFLGNVKVDNGGSNGAGIVKTSGEGKKFLADNGEYKTIINDTAPQSEDTSYSAKQTEKRLDEVTNIIKAGQDSQVNMWQKTTLGATAGSPIVYSTDDSVSIDKIMVQCYKFVVGEDNVVKVLKEFNNGDEANFYHTDNIEFTGVARIKDEYVLENTLNEDGLWESEVINKDEFIILNGIEVV